LCFVPPTDSSVEYSNIDHKLTANQQTGGPIYADLATPPGMTKPPSLDDRVQYSDILPQPTVPAPSVESIPPPLPDKSMVKLINMVLQQGEPDICYDFTMTG